MSHVEVVARAPERTSKRDICFLEVDNWDDFGFKTTYNARFVDADGNWHELGPVKLLIPGHSTGGANSHPLGPGTRWISTTKNLPRVYSLGQDQSYYETARTLGRTGRRVLRMLGDLILLPKRASEIEEEPGYTISLRRHVDEAAVRRFSLVLEGAFRVDSFEFAYWIASSKLELTFAVDPSSMPPTNVHVLIGRNGVGKTTLLRKLGSDVAKGASVTRSSKIDGLLTSRKSKAASFSRVIEVAFSAFDPFVGPTPAKGKSAVSRVYVGLRPGEGVAAAQPQLAGAELVEEFAASVSACIFSAQRERWQKTVSILESDPLIAGFDLRAMAALQRQGVRRRAREVYLAASSGHKVVLLTMAKLVEHVGDQSLVLLDEPETHLHPPLLGSLIRALSALLAERNGVALVASHSPVVLQEVPRSCVWMIDRVGREVRAYRPPIPTFAQNIGRLTSEVFRLEVLDSGHYARIRELCETASTLDEVLEALDGELGSDGRALAAALLAGAAADD